MLARTLACFGLLLALSVPVFGQQRDRQNRNNQKPKPEMKDIDAEGTVFAVSSGQIQMKSGEKPMLVQFTPMTQVRLIGTATIDFLRPRMCVEFVADLDENGTAKKPVDQLAVFTPSAERRLGLAPEGAAAPKMTEEEKKSGKPAAGHIGGDAGLAGGAAAPGGKAPRGHGQKADAGGLPDILAGAGPAKSQAEKIKLPAVCTVRGTITSIHSGKMIVAVKGIKPVTAELVDAPQIEVDVADYHAASQGDGISVKGKGAEVRGTVWVQAEAVKINCVNQLSGPKKRSSKPAAAKAEKPAAKRAAPSKKTDAEAEPAATKDADAGKEKDAPQK
ncbi:MAG: hypothetical protein ABSF26_30120 [Thermoguttaceae bacterium]|jgi:hypothetical protein